MKLTLNFWPKRGRNCTGSRTVPRSELADAQWERIAHVFVERPTGGRPRTPPRPCLEGILWVLRSGARWKDLPIHFPSYPTCWRRCHEWMADGTLEAAWRLVLHELDRKGRVDWNVAMADATFVAAKKGATAWASRRWARVPS